MTATTPTTAPAARLSTVAIIAIAFVAVLVLGGVGALIGKSAESDAKLPHNLGQPTNVTNNLHAGALSHLTATPRATTAGGGPTDDPGAAVDSVTLGENIVTIPVPPDWDATVSDTTVAVSLSKAGFGVFANVYKPAVTPEPAAVVADLLNAWVVEGEGYTDVTPTEIEVDPDIDGYAHVVYGATWVGTNGSLQVIGTIDALVRPDGWVLGIEREAYSSRSIDDAIELYTNEDDLKTIIQGSGDSFLRG